MQFRVVVISSDRTSRERLGRDFRNAGFRVISRDATRPALLSLDEPDLIVLDAGPAPIGVLSDLRLMSRALDVPIVVLLAVASEQAELMCFNAGARDVVARTASSALMIARVRARLPLSVEIPTRGVLRVGPLTLDRDARRLACGSRPVSLSRAEFAIVEMLMSRPGHVIEREAMVRIGWEGPCSGRALESTISRLRCKVRAAGGPTIAVAMHGVGYRLGID